MAHKVGVTPRHLPAPRASDAGANAGARHREYRRRREDVPADPVRSAQPVVEISTTAATITPTVVAPEKVVTVSSEAAGSLAADLRQALQELGLGESVRVD
jgi:hypothetical protein